MTCEATVKVQVNGTAVHTAAEGNGPVNALDAALRKALTPAFPEIADTQLFDLQGAGARRPRRHRRRGAGADRERRPPPALEHGGL